MTIDSRVHLLPWLPYDRPSGLAEFLHEHPGADLPHGRWEVFVRASERSVTVPELADLLVRFGRPLGGGPISTYVRELAAGGSLGPIPRIHWLWVAPGTEPPVYVVRPDYAEEETAQAVASAIAGYAHREARAANACASAIRWDVTGDEVRDALLACAA